MANKLMNRLLFWISGFLVCRIIHREPGVPYLERYFMGSIFGRHVYLHRFLDSDELTTHDHPWDWSISFLICGAYVERRRWEGGTKTIKWFNFLGGDTFHSVQLIPGVFAWSLFCTGPRSGKKWGFMEPIHEWASESTYTHMFRPYTYNVADGDNEDAVAVKWWLTYPRGNQANRERRDYVLSK